MVNKNEIPVLLFLLLVFVAGCVSLYFQIFLTWDASFQLMTILQNESFYKVGARWFMYVMQLPLLFYIKILNGQNLDVATLLYGVTYSFYPFLTNLSIYFQLRKIDQRLMALLMLANIAGSFLYYYHPLSEQIIGLNLCYVLIASLRRQMDKAHLGHFVFQCILFLSISYTHPVTAPMLLMIMYWLWMSRSRFTKPMLASYVAFCLSAAFVVSVITLIYQEKKLTWIYHQHRIINEFSQLWDWERNMMIIIMVSIISLSLFTLYQKKRLSLLLFLASSVMLINWIGSGELAFRKVMDLRFILLLFHLPFLYLLVFRSVPINRLNGLTSLIPILLIMTLIYAGSLRLKGFQRLTAAQKVVDGSCANIEELTSAANYNDRHWSLFFNLSLFKGEKDIDQLVVRGSCESALTEEQFFVEKGKSFPRRGFFIIQAP